MIKRKINNSVVMFRSADDKQPMTCPYTTPVLVPSGSGLANTVGLEVRPCGTHCPLFENLQTTVVLHCNRSQGEGYAIETGETVTEENQFQGALVL